MLRPVSHAEARRFDSGVPADLREIKLTLPPAESHVRISDDLCKDWVAITDVNGTPTNASPMTTAKTGLRPLKISRVSWRRADWPTAKTSYQPGSCDASAYSGLPAGVHKDRADITVNDIHDCISTDFHKGWVSIAEMARILR